MIFPNGKLAEREKEEIRGDKKHERKKETKTREKKVVFSPFFHPSSVTCPHTANSLLHKKVPTQIFSQLKKNLQQDHH